MKYIWNCLKLYLLSGPGQGEKQTQGAAAGSVMQPLFFLPPQTEALENAKS